MANVQKYTKMNVQGLSIHWDRKTENHANKDIDNSRSHLNYDLCTKEGDSLSRLNECLKEVHCLNRKDVNHCACWIVTLPETLKGKTPEEQRLFFEKTYAFLTDRYGGEKNVITATVHNDETTPHMHFAFVPTMFDVKRGMDKVCAKKVVSRKDLIVRTGLNYVIKHYGKKLAMQAMIELGVSKITKAYGGEVKDVKNGNGKGKVITIPNKKQLIVIRLMEAGSGGRKEAYWRMSVGGKSINRAGNYSNNAVETHIDLQESSPATIIKLIKKFKKK